MGSAQGRSVALESGSSMWQGSPVADSCDVELLFLPMPGPK